MWFGPRVWPITTEQDVVISDRNVAELYGGRFPAASALTIEPGGTAVTLRSETPRTVEFFAKRGSVVTPEMERLATSLLDAAFAKRGRRGN